MDAAELAAAGLNIAPSDTQHSDVAGPSSLVDAEITDLVDHVRNRYGAHGLRQLIELATREAESTESALSELADAT